MLSFFRVNDPYRLIVIFFLLLIIRLPFLISDVFLTIPEVLQLTIGSALDEGKVLYSELWTTYAPFSAGVYWFLDWAFGKSQLAHQIVSLLLVFIQAATLNGIFLENKAYNENAYTPALVYIILLNIFFDFSSLSPVLMSMTLIIPSIGYIFQRVDKKTRDEIFLNTGVFLGIATLFHLTTGVFILSTILSLIIFSASLLRRYLLLLLGYVLPITLTWLYYLYNGAEFEFWKFFLFSPQSADRELYLSLDLWIVMIVPFLFLLIGFYHVTLKGRYVNYQVRYLYVMFFGLCASVFALLFEVRLSPHQLIITAPFITFFICHYFLLKRNSLGLEVIFTVFVTAVLVINYGTAFNDRTFKISETKAKLISSTPEHSKSTQGKRILLYGKSYSYYEQSTLASMYLQPDLSQVHFENLDYYDNLSSIYSVLTNSKPEVIIDEIGSFEKIFDRLPLVALKYDKVKEGVYILKN
ncbi:MAG: hypothetical protein AAF363_00510 [Bacteroidota bacterium]